MWREAVSKKCSSIVGGEKDVCWTGYNLQKNTSAGWERRGNVLWTDETKLLILGQGASVCQMALKRWIEGGGAWRPTPHDSSCCCAEPVNQDRGSIWIDKNTRRGHIVITKRKCRNGCFNKKNGPEHASKGAALWFQTGRINVIEGPAQSPDLNPIENMWVDILTLFLRQNKLNGGI